MHPDRWRGNLARNFKDWHEVGFGWKKSLSWKDPTFSVTESHNGLYIVDFHIVAMNVEQKFGTEKAITVSGSANKSEFKVVERVAQNAMEN